MAIRLLFDHSHKLKLGEKVKTFKNLFVTIITISMLAVPVSSAFADGAAVYGKCVSCHGDQGAGSDSAPRLAGQYDWYIVSSFEKFKSGERKVGAGAHKGLSAGDIQAVATYLAALKLDQAE